MGLEPYAFTCRNEIGFSGERTVIADDKLVTFEIHTDLRNSVKPFQGLLDLIRSGHSRGTALALREAVELKADRAYVTANRSLFSGRYMLLRSFLAATNCNESTED